jgi:hypothetical protein
LAVRYKHVGEAFDLISTTVEVPKPFIKEVSNEGHSLTAPLASCQGRGCVLLILTLTILHERLMLQWREQVSEVHTMLM